MSKNSPPSSERSSEFFNRMKNPIDLLDLFEYLPQIFLYIKDINGKFMRVNEALYKKLGATSESQVIGKDDFDFFPPAIASQYLEEDRKVMEQEEKMVDQVWLVPNADGFPAWYLSTKLPVYGADNEVIGLAGFLRPYDFIGPAPAGYERLVPAIEYIATNYEQPIELADLAEIVGLSKSQFQREFNRLFGRSALTYILEVRTSVARRLLESSELTLLEIATQCGFYDQSHFSRQFKRSTGLRPREYRKRYAPGDDA